MTRPNLDSKDRHRDGQKQRLGRQTVIDKLGQRFIQREADRQRWTKGDINSDKRRQTDRDRQT